MEAIIKITKNNTLLKATSLVIGIILWLILSQIHTRSYWYNVPVHFYNQDDKSKKVISPNSIKIELTGKKSAFAKIKKENLSLNIDLSKLKTGKNLYKVSTHDLLIPSNLLVTDHNPNTFFIELQNNG